MLMSQAQGSSPGWDGRRYLKAGFSFVMATTPYSIASFANHSLHPSIHTIHAVKASARCHPPTATCKHCSSSHSHRRTLIANHATMWPELWRGRMAIHSLASIHPFTSLWVLPDDASSFCYHGPRWEFIHAWKWSLGAWCCHRDVHVLAAIFPWLFLGENNGYV